MPDELTGPPLGRSPYNYFQERYCGRGGWAVLVCAVLLNQTNGKQLESVHETFFWRWPTCYHLAVADRDELEEVIKPLGLFRRRAATLLRLSAFYAFIWDGRSPVTDVPGVGKYGSDSYAIFIDGVIPDDVADKELKRYLEWVGGR